MNDFVRIEENEYIYFVNRQNIAGVVIDKNCPHEFAISMIGDTEPTTFAFSNVEERNNKLTEIMREVPDRITDCPQEVSAE